MRDLGRAEEVRATIAKIAPNAGAIEFVAADLNSDAGWANAVTGVDYVLHVASPVPTVDPKSDDELVRPARDGTLRVLKAARDAGVKRVVTTSSTSAIIFGRGVREKPFTEADWTDETNRDDTSPYDRAKTIAERAAWALSESACSQALVFVDACAEKFRDFVQSRDVISNLEVEEVEEFLDSGWYLGVFLSCSPGEKSYPSKKLGHGIWTHFLLEALSGRAETALTRERWLTGDGLQNYLRQEVPRFITRETSIRGTQTPQAILSASNTFRIHYVPRPPAVPADAALAGIRLGNHSEYLEGTETGAIRQLDGFQRGYHTVPKLVTDSANSWCNRLLAERVAEELQSLYQHARTALGVRRKDLRKEEETGAGGPSTSPT